MIVKSVSLTVTPSIFNGNTRLMSGITLGYNKLSFPTEMNRSMLLLTVRLNDICVGYLHL